ncbi:MAG: hypothetical protein JKY01_13495 [Pseudomonadales bacterium]|nr:hypothetical protein [Pseudomonadales bacterium]
MISGRPLISGVSQLALDAVVYCIISFLLVGCNFKNKSESGFKLEQSAVIMQDITRASFAYPTVEKDINISFSTLESHYGDRDMHGFFMVSRGNSEGQNSQKIHREWISGSREARSYAWNTQRRQFLLGGSLRPQIIAFDPAKNTYRKVFPPDNVEWGIRESRLLRWIKGYGLKGWLHQIATHEDYVYMILSTPGWELGEYDGLLKVNIGTSELEVLPFLETSDTVSGYAGVQSVDPSGRVWYYRAYPFNQYWFDEIKGHRKREIEGYKDWRVSSWDEQNEIYYVVLMNKFFDIKKIPVDINSLEEIDMALVADDRSQVQDMLFDRLIKVDFFHSQHFSLNSLYYFPEKKIFFERLSDGDFVELGRVDLGALKMSSVIEFPLEAPLMWNHPQLGDIEVLGVTNRKELIIWLRGRKDYLLVDLNHNTERQVRISAINNSPAEISSLVKGADGAIYGGGLLTMSHLSKFDPHTNSILLLKEAVPNLEGQINLLISGNDDLIYGAAYPDSILFKYDPSLPWRPGSGVESNPINLGAMGSRRQMRVRKGVQALDGGVWFQSESDYEAPKAYALAKADFVDNTLHVKNNIDHDFPIIKDLAVWDQKHLIMFGIDNSGHSKLFLLDQDRFEIVAQNNIQAETANLFTLMDEDNGIRGVFVTEGDVLYKVTPTLERVFVTRAESKITKVIGKDDKSFILVCRNGFEKVIYVNGLVSMEHWDNVGDKPERKLFKDEFIQPVVFVNRKIYLADTEKLWSYTPVH